MTQLHLIALSLTAVLGITVVGPPERTGPDDMLLWGEICGPEDQWDSSAISSRALSSATLTGVTLASATGVGAQSQNHDTHELPRSTRNEDPAWDVPNQTHFDPGAADVTITLTPQTDTPDVNTPLTAGQEARVSVTIKDRQSGLPVTGRSIAGWMLLQRNAQVAAEMPCSAKARLFTQGRVTTRPDVDLNAAKLLVLNREGSIAIVNPQVDFTITQMEGIIPLPGVPADWALAPDRQTLFVSLPVYGAVAVIDTRSFQISGLIELPKGSMPTQLLPLSEGALAVYLSAPGTVTIAHSDGSGQSDPVPVVSRPVVSRPVVSGPVGSGPVSSGPVAMAERFGRVIIAADGKITVINASAGTLIASTLIASTPLPTGTPSLAVAPDGLSVFVTTDTARHIERRDLLGLNLRTSIAVDPGISALALDPAGRHLIALNRASDSLALIDPRSNAVVASARTPPAPVEVTFSHDYAYVRGLSGDHFSVFELAEMHKGNLSPVDIQSAAAPVIAREALSHARMIAPYGHGALIANADEAVAYYYMEGMNTPMGTVKTYGPNVQGLITIDQGFRETAPGLYETTATLPFGGTYDIPIAIDADVTCFSATALPAAKTTADANQTTLRVEPAPPSGIISGIVAGNRGALVVRLIDEKTGTPATGLRDVRVLAFSSSGGWQGRKWADDLGQGRYGVTWTFPKSGRYGLSLQVASAGMGFADQRPVYFNVEPAGDRAVPLKETLP